jgi:hypothetical protein
MPSRFERYYPLFSKILVATLLWIAGVILLAMPHKALAAKASSSSSSSSSSGGGGSYSTSSVIHGMTLDLSGVYLRETKAQGLSDAGGKICLGGMFGQNVGMDLQGTYEVRSANFLVGADVRLVPVSWLFLKVGVGAYNQKETRQLSVVPLGGLGINAPITDTWYLLAESAYFQTRTSGNLNFGAGLGAKF